MKIWKLLWTTKEAHKHKGTLMIVVGGNNKTWIIFSGLAYAQRVAGHNKRNQLSTREQLYGRKHHVTALPEP